MLPLAAFALAAAAPVVAPAAFTIGGEPFAQADILDARAMPDVDGSAAIMLTFSPAAAKRLARVTATGIGKPLPVALDGKVLVAPMIEAPIDGGVIEMAGHFALPEAEALAKRISGKDPLPDSLDQ
ncbi:hypothetical protein FOY91_16365 [Sphingomonas solaris]|uniref:SecDF P1 head subdomain domain-containing protein n=1 Tax=Alterirhizorhabdus solaris TaxID=2529389 RepID=A0A558QWT7_9SPHN|nr:hypothetical protein FOY91_16365 [Sphingomonas solaris]